MDPWLKIKRTCPICKQVITAENGRAHREKREADRRRQQREEELEAMSDADVAGTAEGEVEEGHEMREVRVTMEEDAPSDDESSMEDTGAVTVRPEDDDSSLSVSSTMAFV